MSTKRTIFEDVSEKSTDAQPQVGLMIRVRIWAPRGDPCMDDPLFLLVWAMILVGGLTRLTDSGLSITEWRPLTGALPPMNDAAWWLNLKNTNKFRIPIAEHGHVHV